MKNLSSVLAIALLFSITSCGGGGSSKDPYLGTYTFIVYIDQYYKDVFNIDTKTEEKTDEGEYVYTGKNVDDPNYLFVLAWKPSVGAIRAITNDPYSTGYALAYEFNIGSNDSLSGCMYIVRVSDFAFSKCTSLESSSAKSLKAGDAAARLLSSASTGIGDGLVFHKKSFSPVMRRMVEGGN